MNTSPYCFIVFFFKGLENWAMNDGRPFEFIKHITHYTLHTTYYTVHTAHYMVQFPYLGRIFQEFYLARLLFWISLQRTYGLLVTCQVVPDLVHHMENYSFWTICNRVWTTIFCFLPQNRAWLFKSPATLKENTCQFTSMIRYINMATSPKHLRSSVFHFRLLAYCICALLTSTARFIRVA